MDLAPGTRLAHYEILGTLGRGGMGQVFRARDTKLDREVALKLLPAELGADEKRLQRLEQEARTLARLSHPNIVTIFSVEEADGHRFLTMERIDGQTLDERIGKSGLGIDDLLSLAAPLTAAVAAAHEQGIVHRDLKPANVMIAADGTVKVLDFGLAKLDDDPGPAPAANDQTMTATAMPTPLTDAGTVMGTAPYMSPEQARGEPVDHRSDIFSLGVMLYQMATGRLPFIGKTTADTVSSILRDTPVSVTELKPDLPNHLGRVVRRCLEKDPKTRLQSASDLHHDLIDLGGELSGAIPTTSRAAPSRRMVPIAAIILTVVLAGVGLWKTGWIGGSAPGGGSLGSIEPAAVQDEIIVVFPFENLGPAEDAYFAAGIAEEIGSRLASVPSLGVISRASATQYDRQGKTMATIGEELGVDYVLDGTVRWDRSGSGPSRVRVTPQLIRVSDDQQMWSGRYDETLDEIFVVQSRIATAVLGELNLQLQGATGGDDGERPTSDLEAYQAYLRARENRLTGSYSPEHRKKTIGMLERAVHLDPGFALAWTMLSDEHSYFYHLRYDTTQDRIVAAREAVDRALEIDPDLPEAHLALGLFHYRCFRDYQRALAEFTIAAQGLPNDPELLTAVGAVRRRLGEFEQAVRDTERALKLNPRDSNLAWDIGVTYNILGDRDKAIEMTDRSIRMAPDDAPAYMVKGYAYLLQGDLESAREVLEAMPPTDAPFVRYIRLQQLFYERDFETALESLEAAEWESIDHTTAHWQRQVFLGDLYERAGWKDRADEAYQKALDRVETHLVDRPDDSRRHLSRARALAGLGRFDEAVAAAEHAIELYPPSLDAFHGPHTMLQASYVFARAGDHDRALTLLENLIAGPQKGATSPQQLSLSPDFDMLRDEPRFQALLR